MHNVASKYLGNAMHLCPFFSAVPYMLKPDQGRRNWRAGGAIATPPPPPFRQTLNKKKLVKLTGQILNIKQTQTLETEIRGKG